MRELSLTSPYTSGGDVVELQQRINHICLSRLKGRIGPVNEDGQYGPQTDAMTKRVAWLLGIGKGEPRDPIKKWIVRDIIHPELRLPPQVIRGNKRVVDFLSHRDVVSDVLSWCRYQVGVHETGSSNRGPQVDAWEREVGMLGGPWCGAFVAWPLRHVAHIPVPDGVRYTPYIVGYAQSHTNGFEGWYRWAERRPGDLVLFKFSSGPDIVEHVGILDTDRAHTIEGNTHPDNGGSQTNGGQVCLRDRGSGNVVGLARPRYT